MSNYFFFSEKQKDVLRYQDHMEGCRFRSNYCKLNSGEVKEYTEWTHSPEPFGNWDDYIYLGEGEYYQHQRKIQDD